MRVEGRVGRRFSSRCTIVTILMGMQFNLHSNLSRFIGRRDGRRLPGRMPQESLQSSIGPVLDLSMGGIRVLSTRPYHGDLRICLWGMDVEVSLEGRVVWSRRLGFRRHELGLVFADVDDDVARILTRIGTLHASRRAI